MKSPFPGMDPYLEAHWGDVHASFMVYARNQLNAQLPDDLHARVEAVAVEAEDEARRTVYPDVRVVEEPDAAPGGSSAAAASVAVAEPRVVLLEDEPRTERHLEIVDTSDGGRLVTAIEVLSPFNKVGLEGPAAYVRKQREYVEANVNLVEIDLVRQGSSVLAVREDRIPTAYRTIYRICVRRATLLERAEVYRVPLRESLPNVPIPLRRSDDDVVLRLQPLLDDCHRDGRYHRIDYRIEPVLRLGEADALWADQILRERGLR